MEKNYIAM
jgi:hypothetical protein